MFEKIEGALHVPGHDAPEADAQATAAGMLKHIAVALGIHREAFARCAIPPSDHVPTLAENTEALEIFAGISDHAARLKCLAYMRWIAEQSNRR